MKYRDENGVFQDLYLPPTGDTLPIGSEVDYEGETVPYGWEQVDNPEEYSTDEVKTNKVWIDGKPIYRTVVNIPISIFGTGTATTGGSVNYRHNISNIDIATKLIITWHDNSSQRFIPSSYWATLDWSTQVRLNDNQNNINIEMGKDALNRIRNEGQYMYAIVEYTKTTD